MWLIFILSFTELLEEKKGGEENKVAHQMY
jgi:hypothetical protein